MLLLLYASCTNNEPTSDGDWQTISVDTFYQVNDTNLIQITKVFGNDTLYEYITFNNQGVLLKRFSYLNGLFDGPNIFYDSNRLKTYETYYMRGKEVGPVIKYEKGKIREYLILGNSGDIIGKFTKKEGDWVLNGNPGYFHYSRNQYNIGDSAYVKITHTIPTNFRSKVYTYITYPGDSTRQLVRSFDKEIVYSGFVRQTIFKFWSFKEGKNIIDIEYTMYNDNNSLIYSDTLNLELIGVNPAGND